MQEVQGLRVRWQAGSLLRLAQEGRHGRRQEQPLRVREMLPPPQLRVQVGKKEAFLWQAQVGGHGGRSQPEPASGGWRV